MSLKNIIHVVESNKFFEVSSYLTMESQNQGCFVREGLCGSCRRVRQNDSMVEELELTNIAETLETATKQE
jgi:hypothetical protein